MTRVELLTRLSRLPPSQFEQVLYRAEIPPEHLPGANAPLATRAVEVMRYVEQQKQLDQLARIVQQVVGDSGAAGLDPRVGIDFTAERSRHARLSGAPRSLRSSISC